MDYLMIILGLILLEISSIRVSLDINMKFMYASLLQIYNKGYKIKLDSLMKYKEEIEKNQNSKMVYKINSIMLLIPILNILYTIGRGIIENNAVMNNETIKDGLEPMTEREKEEFASLKTAEEKMNYLSFLYRKTVQTNPIKPPIRNEQSNQELLNVRCNKLIPLAYTYEDVEKLAQAAGGYIVKGRIEGCNIAVIGIPNLKKYNRIKLSKEEKKIRPYIEYSDIEARGKTYLVYPYDDDVERNVQKTIDEIIKSRFEDKSKSNIQYHQIVSVDDKPKVLHRSLRR